MESRAVRIGAIIHMDQPAEFEIRDGIACCTITSGGETIEYRSTIKTAQIGAAAWAIAYARHMACEAGRIIPFVRRKPRADPGDGPRPDPAH